MPSIEEIIESARGLNPVSFSKYDLKLDIENQKNGTLILQQAVDKIYEMSLEDENGPPYYAICLASMINPTGEIVQKTKQEGSIIQVIARIPKLHGSIPKPFRAGPRGLSCDGYVRAAINMHPTFYAIVEDGMDLPKPGNIIKVDISSSDPRYGEYLGTVDPDQKADNVGSGSAKEAFDDPNSKPALNNGSSS